MIAAFVASKIGKELNEDPEYLKRLKEGMIPKIEEKKEFVGVKGAKLSVIPVAYTHLTLPTSYPV